MIFEMKYLFIIIFKLRIMQMYIKFWFETENDEEETTYA